MEMSYSFGNVERLHELRAQEVRESKKGHTVVAVAGLVISVVAVLVLTVYNPLASWGVSAGMAEVLKDVIAFKPM